MPPHRSKAKPRAKKPRRVVDSLTVSVLQATLESTADGILVVDLVGKIVSHNRHFEEIRHLSHELISANNNTAAGQRLITHVRTNFTNQNLFLDGIQKGYTMLK